MKKFTLYVFLIFFVYLSLSQGSEMFQRQHNQNLNMLQENMSSYDLDSMVDLLLELHSQGKTLVIASHDEEVKKLGNKTIQIKDLKT